MIQETKQTALFWLDAGIATVPLCYRSKFPAGQSLIKSGLWQLKEGEVKGHWTPLKTKLPTKSQIEVWFEDGRYYNLALVTGWQNILVLDFDAPELYAAFYCWHLEHNPKILETYRVMSNRGVHIYYYLSEPVKLNTIQHSLFEVKANGKMATTPPSVHESGKPYTSLDNPENIRIVKPDEILNYSPVHFEPLVYPTLKRSRYAPTILNDNDVIPAILQIPILSFFNHAIPVDAEKRFYRTDCPFHGHKSNFWIDTKLNICGCFAGCIGRPSLDAIDFFTKLKDVSKRDAIIELRRML